MNERKPRPSRGHATLWDKKRCVTSARAAVKETCKKDPAEAQEGANSSKCSKSTLVELVSRSTFLSLKSRSGSDSLNSGKRNLTDTWLFSVDRANVAV